MNMTTTEQRPSFDQILAQSQSRSRSGSANSSSLVASLPPPPRRRKPPTPESLTTPSTTSLAMQRLPLTASESQVSISSPFRNPSSIVDGEPGPLRRPNPFTFYDGGHQAHKYADSLSSLNSYSNLFYKPEDDARETPIPTVRQDDDQSSDHASLNDAISVEDYSALLYPELQHGNTPPPRSPRPSIEVHGPPVRKRIPSFASNEGPESPVEFANIGVLSLPPSVSSPDEHRPSKVDRILGMDSSHSSRRGSTEKLIPQSGRRDSFMEFDIVGSRAPITEPQLRSQPSVSDEMPIFAPRHIRSILPNSSIGGYKALLEEVDNKEATDTAPKLDSRQILVDGSDRPRAARSPGSNQGSNRSSAASESLEPRLSTSNFLDKQERADAVRKNRKIAQVLGPGVLPEAQALTRVGRTTPTQDTADSGRDMTYRTGRSYSLALDDARSEAIFKTQARGTRSHRPPALHSKSSWSPLENETIFLGPNGRRHSSPMNPSFDHSKISQRIDSDAMSMSSLGSIITAERRTINTKPARAGSPSSFMEMSDEEGATTPKRRPSIESARQPMQDLKHAGRTASLNDIVTISNALESPRRVSIPDTPFTEHSVPISARHRRSDLSEAPFRGQRDSWDEQIRKDEEQLERQRKREKLAKIHRYLGSKVPPELVLGYSSSTTSPPIEIMVSQTEYVAPPDQKEVKKRRRSSSAVLYQHTQKSDPPRHKEAESRSKDTLTDAERLTKIKRAQKIEQIFGESPSRPRSLSIPRPSSAQGLMHQPVTPTTPSKRTTVATPIPEHPQNERGFKPRSPFIWKEGRPSTAGSSRPSTAQSTSGLISSYQKDVEREKKSRSKKESVDANQPIDTSQVIDISPHFPVGTALGSPWEDVYGNVVLDISPNAMANYPSKSPVLPGVPTSRQFLDYRNSLNSLSRILDHDDRQSLNDLHAVLDSDEENEDDPDLQPTSSQSQSAQAARSTISIDNTTTPPKRVLQPRASLISINSVATTSTFATLTPDPMAFQARRKRAAKLAQFFGASYRDLFGEVLVRIERGMLEEARAGQISEEEVRHLMKQLNKLKSRQSQIA